MGCFAVSTQYIQFQDACNYNVNVCTCIALSGCLQENQLKYTFTTLWVNELIVGDLHTHDLS